MKTRGPHYDSSPDDLAQRRGFGVLALAASILIAGLVLIVRGLMASS
jgi:hypothetical protein